MKQTLSFFDSVSLMVGIIVGVGIFETTPDIAAQMHSISAVFGIWILGGLLSLCGALCYAELAAAYPKNGGDYVYLSHAYGQWLGFLFAWGRIAVVQPGMIAAISFPFAHFFIKMLELSCGITIGDAAVVPVAACGVLVLTLLNCFGLRVGARTQNTLTVIKVAGLVLITIIAFCAPESSSSSALSASSLHGFGLAIILVMFTFGGWSDIAYVAAEVHNSVRNIPRIIICALLVVGALYLLANAGFFWALGYSGVVGSKTVAVDALKTVLPLFAQAMVSALIAISALGTINALLFTGARISHAVGLDFLLFRILAVESKVSGGPLASLLFLGVSSACIIVLMGSFERTVVYTTPVVWFFYLLSSLGLIVLRSKEKFTVRPFLVPLYPVLPISFAIACIYIFYSAIAYELLGSLISVGILLLGIPLYKVAMKVAAIKHTINLCSSKPQASCTDTQQR